MALTILSEKFSAILFSAVFSLLTFYLLMAPAFSRENFEFNLGQKINILSDKAFRKSSENEFEAIGNVVITHLKNSIYGEKARVNFTSGDAEIVGNVRYIAPDITLYGSQLQYNFITRQIIIDNARVLSENFVVTGKKIIQTNASTIYAEEAEYSTCRDCPESWSVYGKQVTIDIGQYVNLRHAFVKVNGVVAMYFPYIVFPIKQKRETGVLFPTFGFSSKEGFRYQQPFFWAIDDYKDVTIIPSTFGNRGLGGEFQYRQNFTEKTWLELNSLQLNDKIYAPYKTSKDKSGSQYYRHFSDFEFHSIYKHFFNSHFYLNNASDLDAIRDFDFFAKEKLRGTELGGGGFLEARSSVFSMTAEGYFHENMFINDPRVFDNRYVQILPKLSLSTVPYNLLHSNYFFAKNISVGLNSDYTIFKQNRIDTAGPIRNARRLNLAPYLDWRIGNLGPVYFSHEMKLDYQTYNFPYETDKKHFSKKGVIYETEAVLELERVFGLAYNENKPIDSSALNASKTNSTTIGSLPSLRTTQDEPFKTVLNSSYRHSQEYKIKHYYLSDQKFSGSDKFKGQIQNDAGQFDYLDAIRSKEYLSNQITALDSLPLSNTIEVQWNNYLIRKNAKKFDPYIDGRYLKDNFDYTNISFFEISQGVDLSAKSDNWSDKLTRLYINTGLNFNRMSFGLQEFYFHRLSEHKITSSLAYSLDRASVAGTFTYNSFNSSNTPVAKLLGYNLSLSPTDLITLKNSMDYDIATKRISQSSYSVLYSPLNNCWKLELNYARDLIDNKFGFLFYINYNENNFTSLNVR